MHPHRALFRWVLALALAACGVSAIAQADPPARVGSVSDIEGSVVFAPTGESEWTPAPLNRPITAGDRLWTDPDARADVHLGTAVLHLDSQTFVEVRALDEAVLQSLLHEGVLLARVRELRAGELFEIDTPQLAFRALQPGTYRIDADTARRVTRVTVREGRASVSGRSGRSITVYPGQQLEVAGSDLEQIASVSYADNDFDTWSSERDAREDQSLATHYVAPEVVGSSQLDSYGHWSRDASYGSVWYPSGLPSDWAPYRYGTWQWIRPWGWTWIDNAPWGFAPFHYGRWALIGSHWAWVPGRLGRRPVYAPALVSFVGAGSGATLELRAGESVGWYPLAPGEAWQPFFAASAAYRHRANESVGGGAAKADAGPLWRRPNAVTAVRIEEFRSGEPVQRHWVRTSAADLSRAQPLLLQRGTLPQAMDRTAAAPSALPAWTAQQPIKPTPAPAAWPRSRGFERPAAPHARRAPPHAAQRGRIQQQEGPLLAPRPSRKLEDGVGRQRGRVS